MLQMVHYILPTTLVLMNCIPICASLPSIITCTYHLSAFHGRLRPFRHSYVHCIPWSLHVLSFPCVFPCLGLGTNPVSVLFRRHQAPPRCVRPYFKFPFLFPFPLSPLYHTSVLSLLSHTFAIFLYLSSPPISVLRASSDRFIGYFLHFSFITLDPFSHTYPIAFSHSAHLPITLYNSSYYFILNCLPFSSHLSDIPHIECVGSSLRIYAHITSFL